MVVESASETSLTVEQSSRLSTNHKANTSGLTRFTKHESNWQLMSTFQRFREASFRVRRRCHIPVIDYRLILSNGPTLAIDRNGSAAQNHEFTNTELHRSLNTLSPWINHWELKSKQIFYPSSNVLNISPHRR